MSNLESVLAKHASKFIDPKHSKRALQGIYFDGLGGAWLTDGIALLRLTGFPSDCIREVRSISGKVLDVTLLDHSSWVGFIPDASTVAVLNVDDVLTGVLLLGGVAKTVKEDILTLQVEEGRLLVRFSSTEIKGQTELCGCDINFTCHLNRIRFAACLSVFDGLSETVEVKTFERGGGTSLMLSAPGVDVLLMGGKKI